MFSCRRSGLCLKTVQAKCTLTSSPSSGVGRTKGLGSAQASKTYRSSQLPWGALTGRGESFCNGAAGALSRLLLDCGLWAATDLPDFSQRSVGSRAPLCRDLALSALLSPHPFPPTNHPWSSLKFQEGRVILEPFRQGGHWAWGVLWLR